MRDPFCFSSHNRTRVPRHKCTLPPTVGQGILWRPQYPAHRHMAGRALKWDKVLSPLAQTFTGYPSSNVQRQDWPTRHHIRVLSLTTPPLTSYWTDLHWKPSSHERPELPRKAKAPLKAKHPLSINTKRPHKANNDISSILSPGLPKQHQTSGAIDQNPSGKHGHKTRTSAARSRPHPRTMSRHSVAIS